MLPWGPWQRLMSISAGLVPRRGSAGSVVWTRSPDGLAKPPRKNCSRAHFRLLEQERLSWVVFKCLFPASMHFVFSSVLLDGFEKVIKKKNNKKKPNNCAINKSHDVVSSYSSQEDRFVWWSSCVSHMEVPLPPSSPQPAYTAQRAEFKLDFSLHMCPCAGYSLTNLTRHSSWGSELVPGCLDSNPTFKYYESCALGQAT